MATMFTLACSSAELTEAGRHVTYTTSTLDVSGCDDLGAVNSSESDHAAAIHQLRNEVAERGGTHVLVEEEHAQHARGVAYKCP